MEAIRPLRDRISASPDGKGRLDFDEVPMAWKRDANFTGGSGQMAVMGELLHRKCNAAIPQMDVGMDVFAFRDDREDVARIQVKTGPGKTYKGKRGYHARFGVPMDQLRRTDNPPLFYALAVRLEADKGWGDFIVIGRAKLKELWDNNCGSENASSRKFSSSQNRRTHSLVQKF